MEEKSWIVRKAQWVNQPYDAVRIDFEDGTMFLLSLEDVSPNQFPNGMLIDAIEYERLNALHAALAAWQGVLRRLGRSAVAKQTLLQGLIREGYERDLAEMTVERAERMGLLNDQALAKRWTEQRTTQQNKGRLRIKAELQQKGIQADLATAATNAIDVQEEYDRALHFAEKRWPSLKGEWKQRQAKLGRQLQSRGFPMDMIRKILRSFTSDS